MHWPLWWWQYTSIIGVLEDKDEFKRGRIMDNLIIINFKIKLRPRVYETKYVGEINKTSSKLELKKGAVHFDIINGFFISKD